MTQQPGTLMRRLTEGKPLCGNQHCRGLAARGRAGVSPGCWVSCLSFRESVFSCWSLTEALRKRPLLSGSSPSRGPPGRKKPALPQCPASDQVHKFFLWPRLDSPHASCLRLATASLPHPQPRPWEAITFPVWLPTPTRSNLRDTHVAQAVIWAPPASSGGSVRRSVNWAAERPSPGAAPRVSRYQPPRHSCCQHPLPVPRPAPSTGILMKLRSVVVMSVLIPVTTSDHQRTKGQVPWTPLYR